MVSSQNRLQLLFKPHSLIFISSVSVWLLKLIEKSLVANFSERFCLKSRMVSLVLTYTTTLMLPVLPTKCTFTGKLLPCWDVGVVLSSLFGRFSDFINGLSRWFSPGISISGGFRFSADYWGYGTRSSLLSTGAGRSSFSRNLFGPFGPVLAACLLSSGAGSGFFFSDDFWGYGTRSSWPSTGSGRSSFWTNLFGPCLATGLLSSGAGRSRFWINLFGPFGPALAAGLCSAFWGYGRSKLFSTICPISVEDTMATILESF